MPEMKILSIRRITNDRRHNAFTGACWFKGNLYVAYRQGDMHADDDQGRQIVMRSRDKGITWDTVAVCRGDGDTRDAHLYSDGQRLFAVGFQAGNNSMKSVSGCAFTEDGDRWTTWRAYTDTGEYVLWRPEWYKGRHYCAGYHETHGVHWFESEDGLSWRDIRIVYDSPEEEPNECALEILPDGTATMLMRCEKMGQHPYLCRSCFPFDSWEMQRLEDISLTGPSVWTVNGNVFIGCRWHLTCSDVRDEGGSARHTAIFKVAEGKTILQCVLPSGPRPDHSYMGVARWPENRHRFAISFYSNAIANEDPAIEQWSHPQIYLADILFGAEFIQEMLVSELADTRGIDNAVLPDPEMKTWKFRPVKTGKVQNFIDAHEIIRGRAGTLYFVKDIDIGPVDEITLHLGYDGPVKVWWNKEVVFAGPGTNPAREDMTSVRIRTKHGRNRLAVALDTNGGKAWGIFARYESL